MIRHAFLSDWKLHYVRADEPFSLLDLVQLGERLVESSGPEADLDLPGLFDLRSVELNNDSTPEIKRAIRLRKSMQSQGASSACAYVVGSKGSFGIMRMFAIYAELEGLRNEELTLVTEDIDEAVDWLATHLDTADRDAEALRARLSQLSGPVRSTL